MPNTLAKAVGTVAAPVNGTTAAEVVAAGAELDGAR